MIQTVMTIGLTGGIACGKTTAAARFSNSGFRVVDTDEIVHALLAEDARVIETILRRYGESALQADGGVNRGYLASIVFNEPAELRWLEELLHPKVIDEWQRRVAAEPRVSWLVQIPLLFEKRLEKHFDLTVCVASSTSLQRKRLLDRGLSEEESDRRIATQLPVASKIESADFTLLNEGELTFLYRQVDRLIQLLENL